MKLFLKYDARASSLEFDILIVDKVTASGIEVAEIVNTSLPVKEHGESIDRFKVIDVGHIDTSTHHIGRVHATSDGYSRTVVQKFSQYDRETKDSVEVGMPILQGASDERIQKIFSSWGLYGFVKDDKILEKHANYEVWLQRIETRELARMDKWRGIDPIAMLIPTLKEVKHATRAPVGNRRNRKRVPARTFQSVLS